LVGDFKPEEIVPHEHAYIVEWICTVSELDGNGFGVDIDLLTAKLDKVMQGIDGVLLNDLPFFRDRQSSIENTALFIAESLFHELTIEGYPMSNMREWEVRVWESDTAWASFVKTDFH
jgi:6-pyruvoyl-tetrahydropterin synthase